MKKFSLLSIFILVLLWFRNAFNVYVFADDFYLFSISKASSLDAFINFFSPFKSYGFYRPLGIEVFYFLANVLNNLIIVRLIVFATFFFGLVFLYKLIAKVFISSSLGLLTTLLYSINFVHVYQLYWLATYQEVALFAFSLATIYYFVCGKKKTSLFFYILALFSREQSMLIPGVLFFISLNLKKIKDVIPYLVLAFPFIIVYKLNYPLVAIQPEYTVHIDLKLISNNLLWYFLWGLGFPASLPNFFISVFQQPLSSFWKYASNMNFIVYISSLLLFIILCVSCFCFNAKKFYRIVSLCVFGFLVFVLPTTVILHKWMVRLTLPLIFIVFIYTYLIWFLYRKNGFSRIVGIILIILYFIWNFFGVLVHESDSTYIYESKISRNVESYLLDNFKEISNYKYIYFEDQSVPINGWYGSKKLKQTLSNQAFLSYFFPGQTKVVNYNFESKKIPEDSYVLQSNIFLK